ncbi:hypothetical protein ABEG96_22385, partial [Pantoea agglomerans]
PAYGPQNDVTLKMPAFEWVHVQLHQQKGMISLSPPTICNSALHFLSATSRLLNTQTGIVSQRILQFFEISDLRIVTKICVDAQINGDYCRLM